ncbi:tetratricopeptide repeat protein [Brytella acorum]|uniref:Tetratricopeptide repeat protein n=1 Tax=Brytella acorum TaxID=2959299 RepID=A0AA35Y2A6_9PROT|nr:tetratricopeptide repeat protein [Brytella acorum]MDF3623476.1 tetratricopeptide repeat protein [Brytella acorum]CAI9121392.1 tetratricopeptide repeat protein [Brytella acorum]
MIHRFRQLFRRPPGRGRSPTTHPLPQPIAEIRQRALEGHVLDQVKWGDILLDGSYISRDPHRARQWFEIAANAGYGPAYNMLGRCHQFGWGCTRELGEAIRYYEMAMALGDLWGTYNLGIMTMRGLGVAVDRPRALSLFRKAAEQGHAKSMNLVARFTEEGWHTRRDPMLARAWYRRSAEGGDYRGRHNYATLLLAENRREEALEWWRRAVGEATSDILLAMHRNLSELGTDGDAGLLAEVEKRLTAMNISRDIWATTSSGKIPSP